MSSPPFHNTTYLSTSTSTSLFLRDWNTAARVGEVGRPMLEELGPLPEAYDPYLLESKPNRHRFLGRCINGTGRSARFASGSRSSSEFWKGFSTARTL